MIDRILLFTLLLALTAGAQAAGGGVEHDGPPVQTRLESDAALQRGARLYVNYCAGCHSLQYMRYQRLAEDLNLSEDEVLQNFAASSDAKIHDTMTIAMADAQGEAWFGQAPPDLSLVARSRGVDWLFHYLTTFYVDDSRPLGWNNQQFPNASMPHVLWKLQGVQKAHFRTETDEHGDAREVLDHLELVQPGEMTPEEYESAMVDLVSFLQYVGEPAKRVRESIGVWVLLFLALFTFLAFLLKAEFWRDVH